MELPHVTEHQVEAPDRGRTGSSCHRSLSGTPQVIGVKEARKVPLASPTPRLRAAAAPASGSGDAAERGHAGLELLLVDDDGNDGAQL